MKSIELSQIFHAGHIIEDGKTKLLFDPLLFSNFAGNFAAFPEVKFNYDVLKKWRFDAIFISHFHSDHYCLNSLNLLDKNIPIYMYAKDSSFLLYIQCLGFKKIHQLTGIKKVKVNDFLVHTFKNKSDIESGFVVEHGHKKILNLVDVNLNQKNISALNQKFKNFDLIIFPYQVAPEIRMFNSNELKAFPASKYFKNLNSLKKFNCDNFLIGSCQYRYSPDDFRNYLNFPISQEKAISDFQKLYPDKHIGHLPPGKLIKIEKNKFTPLQKKLNFLSCKKIDSDYIWNPNIVIPPIGDLNENPNASIDQFSEKFIDHIFQNKMEELSAYKNLSKLLGTNIFWTLRLHKTDRNIKEYTFQFADKLKRVSKRKQNDFTTDIASIILHKTVTGEIPLVSLAQSGELRYSGAHANLNSCPLFSFLNISYQNLYYRKTIQRLRQ